MSEREEIAKNIRKEAQKIAGKLVASRLGQGRYSMAHKVKARLLIRLANDIEAGRL